MRCRLLSVSERQRPHLHYRKEAEEELMRCHKWSGQGSVQSAQDSRGRVNHRPSSVLLLRSSRLGFRGLAAVRTRNGAGEALEKHIEALVVHRVPLPELLQAKILNRRLRRDARVRRNLLCVRRPHFLQDEQIISTPLSTHGNAFNSSHLRKLTVALTQRTSSTARLRSASRCVFMYTSTSAVKAKSSMGDPSHLSSDCIILSFMARAEL
jgi:hypothetical protein